jgi:hypothetical protein
MTHILYDLTATLMLFIHLIPRSALPMFYMKNKTPQIALSQQRVLIIFLIRFLADIRRMKNENIRSTDEKKKRKNNLLNSLLRDFPAVVFPTSLQKLLVIDWNFSFPFCAEERESCQENAEKVFWRDLNEEGGSFGWLGDDLHLFDSNLWQWFQESTDGELKFLGVEFQSSSSAWKLPSCDPKTLPSKGDPE